MHPQSACSAYSAYFAIADVSVSPFVLLEVVDVYVYSREWAAALTVLRRIINSFPAFSRFNNAIWLAAMVLLQVTPMCAVGITSICPKTQFFRVNLTHTTTRALVCMC